MQSNNPAIQFLSGLAEGTLIQLTTPHPKIVTTWALVAASPDPNQLRLIEVPTGVQHCIQLEGSFDWDYGHNLAIQCGMTADKDAIVLQYIRVPCPAEAAGAARILLQSWPELRNPQYADHSWMARHLVQLAKAAPITITQPQLDVLMADVSMAIARYGYKCPTGFEPSEQDAARGINTADLYSLLMDLKQQYGQPTSQPE